ncbi:uncharacterized protein [Rutidosis leptorrhynchoides]|uniref:uncharacterized protein isoform X2 n=1 Tax=Rutidosis leptorrhynchoides TaxID=125765 RepID=UPI003A9936F6
MERSSNDGEERRFSDLLLIKLMNEFVQDMRNCFACGILHIYIFLIVISFSRDYTNIILRSKKSFQPNSTKLQKKVLIFFRACAVKPLSMFNGVRVSTDPTHFDIRTRRWDKLILTLIVIIHRMSYIKNT